MAIFLDYLLKMRKDSLPPPTFCWTKAQRNTTIKIACFNNKISAPQVALNTTRRANTT